METKYTTSADIVILTVNDHEQTAVIEAFCGTNTPTLIQGKSGQSYFDFGTINSQRVVCAPSLMASHGAGATFETALDALKDLNPSVLLAVGIAWGSDKKKQAIGEVLLSQQLQKADHKKIGDGTILLRGSRPEATAILIKHFKNVATMLPERPKVHHGILLSLETLFDDKQARDALLALCPEAVGGEMEGLGLYHAIRRYEDECSRENTLRFRRNWLVVKAICDWGYSKQSADKERNQAVAAKQAARLTFEVIKKLDLRSGSYMPQDNEEFSFDTWAAAYKKFVSKKAHKALDPELLVFQKTTLIPATSEQRTDNPEGSSYDENVVNQWISDALYVGGDTHAFDILQKNPRVILQAGPGAGKSTCGLNFCVQQNKNSNGLKKRLALYLNLHDYKETGLDNLICNPHFNESQPGLSELPDDWDIFLILDALDECPYALTPKCLNDIHELVVKKRHFHFAVLMRPMWRSLDQFGEWKRFKLEAFEETDRQRYLEKRLKWPSDQLEILYTAIDKQPGHEYLYTNPFFLSIFSEVVQPPVGGVFEIPGRTQMMDRYVERVIHREFVEKMTPVGGDLKSVQDIKKMALEALNKTAFAIGLYQVSGRNSMSLYNIVEEHDSQAKGLIQILIKRNVILEETLSGVAFTHDLLKQFFLSRYLVSYPHAIVRLPQKQHGEWNGLLSFLLEHDHQARLPPPIVNWAWDLDKLLVTFGLCNEDTLKTLRIPELPEDPWTRGLLKAGRGEEVNGPDGETNEILEQRLCSPQDALEQRLKDPILWFIGCLGPEGKRITRIKDLIFGNIEPWGELMPAIVEGNTAWREELKDADVLRFCLRIDDVRDQPAADRIGAHEPEMSPWELALFVSRCAEAGLSFMKWNAKLLQYLEQISTRRLHRLFVRAAFRGAVEQGNTNGRLLFNFIVTRRKLIPELANIFPLERVKKALRPEVRAEMLNVLPPVEMSLGVRKKLFNAEEVPESWKTYWALKVNPVEARNLLETGILSAGQISEQKLSAWKAALGADEAAGLVKAKLLKEGDFSPHLVRRWLDESDRFELFELFKTHTITKETATFPEFVDRAFATLTFGQCWYLLRNKFVLRESIPQSFWNRAIQSKDEDPVAFAFLLTEGRVFASDISERCKEKALEYGPIEVRSLFLKEKILTLKNFWDSETRFIKGITEEIAGVTNHDNIDASNARINRKLRDRPFTFVVVRKDLMGRDESFYTYHPFWNYDITFTKGSGIPYTEVMEGLIIQSFVNVAFQRRIGIVDFRPHAAKGKTTTGKFFPDYGRLIVHGEDDKKRLYDLQRGTLTQEHAQEIENHPEMEIPPFDQSRFYEHSIERIRKRVQIINNRLKNLWLTLNVVETKPEKMTGVATHRDPEFWIAFSFDNFIEKCEPSKHDWMFCRVMLKHKFGKWKFYVRNGALLLRNE